MKNFKTLLYTACLATLILSGPAQAFEIYNNTDRTITAIGQENLEDKVKFNFGSIPPQQWSRSWLPANPLSLPATVIINWEGSSYYVRTLQNHEHGYLEADGVCAYSETQNSCTNKAQPVVRPDLGSDSIN